MSAFTIAHLLESFPLTTHGAIAMVVNARTDRYRVDLVLFDIVQELDRRKRFALAADVAALISDTPNVARWRRDGGYYDEKGDWCSFLSDLARLGLGTQQQRAIEAAREAASYVGD